MDVDRLMRDLTVEQLENIQLNLEKEMEGKKENLREMVGRRYRDVLEASSEVRNVCSLAEKLATDIAKTRVNYQSAHIRTGSRDEQKAGEHFYAINYLVTNIGSDDGEPLDDVIALCMVEHLQKQLISNHSSPMIHKVARALTNRIVSTRSELESNNIETLSDISRSDWATNQLVAISVLQGKDITQLLDLYLEKRYGYIAHLIEDSATILTIVDEIKKTLSVVEELFIHGELLHAIQSVCNGQYRCELVREMCADQAFSFEKTIGDEIEKVWRHLREKLTVRGSQTTIATQIIGEKCLEWIEKACSLAHRVVAEVCDYFDNLDQVIDLLQAITNSLKQDWPKVGPNRTVYEKLLQNVVVDKSKKLLTQMIETIEKSSKVKFESINDGPSGSVFADRTYRPDSQSHIGISTQLYKCVKQLWDSLESVNEKCLQFESICASMSDTTTAAALKDTMATNTLQLLLRLCELHNTSDSDETMCSSVRCANHLSRARLALVLIHSESTLVCTLLDKDSQRITMLSQKLHSISEESLTEFCKLVAKECITPTSLADYIESFEGEMYALRLVMEFQTVELPDVSEGTVPVSVPIGLSPPIHSVLFDIASRLCDSSISHLLTKNMKKKVGQEISNCFAEIIGDRIEKLDDPWPLPTRSTLQVLFDCQVLQSMFPSEKLRAVCSSIQSHLDPFDVSLLSPLLSANVKIAYIRSQVLFSSLIVDTLSNKDAQLPESYSQIKDLAVHIDSPSRIPMIPRLDKAVGEDPTKMGQSRTKNNKYLANPHQQGSSKNTPSLSAFYDRISSSWFGANN